MLGDFVLNSLFNFSRTANPRPHLPPFSFQAALQEHVRWKVQFEAALRMEGIGYNESQVLRGAGTSLASWLEQTSSSDPAVVELRHAFVQFHTAAARALDLTRAGDVAAALQVTLSLDYLLTSKRIKRLLVEMEKRRLYESPGSGLPH
jgi:hypothetical protein